jgi:hypothetical protein
MSSRIADSFGADDEERILKYLDWLRSVSIDYVQSIRRTAVILVFLVAVFELVANSRDARITVSSFDVTRGSVVLIFLPALISYLYLQIASDTVKADRVIVAFMEAEKIWAPSAAQNDLDVLLMGSQPIFLNVFAGRQRTVNRQRADTAEEVASATFLVIFYLGVFAFVAQAYYVLFSTHIATLIAWSVSLCVAIFCLVFSAIIWLAGASE